MDPPYQQFHSIHSTGISDIRARFDDRAACYVILWSEIKLVFKYAHYVANGSRLVPFMVGDNFRKLTPRRIEYHPEVVLQIIPRTHTRGLVYSVPPTSPENGFDSFRGDGSVPLADIQPHTTHQYMETTHANIASKLQNLSDHTSSTMDAIKIRAASLSASHTKLQNGSYLSPPVRIAPGNGLVLRSTLATMPQYGFHPYSQPRVALDKSADVSSLASDEPKGQSAVTELNQLYGSYVDAEMSGQAMQAEQFKNVMSQRFKISPSGLQLTDVVLLRMLQTQNQIITRQAFLQNSVQALITQTYELHEYPIPRLFVVLPKPKRLRDKFKPTTSFKLYFLCECGENTATPGTRIPHEIHLVKHEGYDVDQPNRFFEKYGSYVLTILNALRFGITIAGVAIPSLLQVAEGINSIEKIIGVTAKEVGSLMDETIRYIKDHERDSKGYIDKTNSGIKLDMLEALEGADLRELQSYLSAKDESRVLGNLYRITTLEGHIKWVCMDHFRENYRHVSMQKLKDVVTSNRGWYFPEGDFIIIQLRTSTVAKQFYDVLVKARGLRSLDITLKWDATMNDLRTLTSVVNMANISDMTLSSLHLNGPAMDLVNNSRRYDPIVQLMCNGRIRTMKLHLKTFFQHISSSSIQTTSQLKELYLEVGPFLANKSSRSLFTKLLRNCPSLTKLEMKEVDLGQGYTILESKAFAFQNIIMVIYGISQLQVKLLHGKIQSAGMYVNGVSDFSVDEKALVLNGTLTELSFRAGAPSSGAELSDLLRNNRALTKLSLHYVGPNPAIVDRIINARSEYLSRNGTSSLQEIKVILHQGDHKIKFTGLKMALTFRDDSHVPVISSVLEHRDPDFSLKRLSKVLEEYSWTIQEAELLCDAIDDIILLLHKGMQEKGSRLKSLHFHPQSLTCNGVNCVEEIIRLSGNLELHMDFYEDSSFGIIEEYDLNIVEACLQRFAPTLRRLTLGSNNGHVPIEVVMYRFSTRLDVPKLEELEVHINPIIKFNTLEVINWVVSMTAMPPYQTRAVSQGQKNTFAWTPLRILTLPIRLTPEEWSMILEALDYLALEDLNLSNSNIDVKEMQTLLDSIPVDASLTINLCDTLVKQDAHVDSLLSGFQMKVPDVTILIGSFMDIYK